MTAIAIGIGDRVSWKGARHLGYRTITGTVRHIGRLFVSVSSDGRNGNSQETYIRQNKITAINGNPTNTSNPAPPTQK